MGHRDLPDELNALTGRIVDAAREVWWHLGPGLRESVYEEALLVELTRRGVHALRKVRVPVTYKGVRLSDPMEIDVLVEGQVVVEAKAVLDLHPAHFAQTRTYLRLGGHNVGLLLNFHAARFQDAVHRIVLRRPRSEASSSAGSADPRSA